MLERDFWTLINRNMSKIHWTRVQRHNGLEGERDPGLRSYPFCPEMDLWLYQPNRGAVGSDRSRTRGIFAQSLDELPCARLGSPLDNREENDGQGNKERQGPEPDSTGVSYLIQALQESNAHQARQPSDRISQPCVLLRVG